MDEGAEIGKNDFYTKLYSHGGGCDQFQKKLYSEDEKIVLVWIWNSHESEGEVTVSIDTCTIFDLDSIIFSGIGQVRVHENTI